MEVKPVFIFSLPRSGSTLLQRLLAAHPDIETISEPWFLIPFVYTLRDHGVFAEYGASSLYKTISHLSSKLPNGDQDYYDALRQFAEMLYSKLNNKNSKYFLDKTPRYYLIIREIARIFPGARFIFLFRNPLATLSSTMTAFHRGRLGDSWHKIDIFKGPSLLAEGYKALADKSMAIRYEDLIEDPEKSVNSICQYLSLPYHESMINDFNKVELTGMGDKVGTNQYMKVDKASLEKWRTVFNTKYRKQYALRYIKYLGADTISTFGYEMHDIIRELNELNPESRGGIKDRYNIACCNLRSFFEFPLFKKKIRSKIRDKEKFYLHF